MMSEAGSGSTKKDGNEAWQNDTLALPRLEKGQLAEIKLSYKDNGLEIDVNGQRQL